VHKGLEQADRGEFVDESEMESRISRMIQAWCASTGRLRRRTICDTIHDYLREHEPHLSRSKVIALRGKDVVEVLHIWHASQDR